MIKVMLNEAYDVFVANTIKKWLKKRFDKEIKQLTINDVTVSTKDGNTNIHIDIFGVVEQEDVFALILEKMGL